MGIEVILLAGSIVTALAAIYKHAVSPVLKFAKRGAELIELLGALDERVGTLEARTKQLTHNGGSHMRDDVSEIRKLLEEHIAWSVAENQGVIAEMGEMWEAIRHGYLSTGGKEASIRER